MQCFNVVKFITVEGMGNGKCQKCGKSVEYGEKFCKDCQ